MATSDEDLKKKQEHVARLREQVAAEEAKRVTREAELANDVTMAQLTAEEARLEAQLTAARQANKVTAVKDGASAPLQSAREQMEQALAVQKAQEQASDQADKASDTKES